MAILFLPAAVLLVTVCLHCFENQAWARRVVGEHVFPDPSRSLFRSPVELSVTACLHRFEDQARTHRVVGEHVFPDSIRSLLFFVIIWATNLVVWAFDCFNWFVVRNKSVLASQEFCVAVRRRHSHLVGASLWG